MIKDIYQGYTYKNGRSIRTVESIAHDENENVIIRWSNSGGKMGTCLYSTFQKWARVRVKTPMRVNKVSLPREIKSKYIFMGPFKIRLHIDTGRLVVTPREFGFEKPVKRRLEIRDYDDLGCVLRTVMKTA